MMMLGESIVYADVSILRKGEQMNDLDIIIFFIAGVAIILISLYVVISMTRDINEIICKCNEIGTWAKNELERRNDG